MGTSSVSADEVRAALDRLLASAAFHGRERPSALLRYIVEAALAGRTEQLKEYTLGAEALGRGERFDPRVDPIARVEASRLRGRLELYYADEGRADPVVILLPKGGYAPRFQTQEPGSERAPEGMAARPRLLLVVGAAGLGALLALTALAFTLGRGAAPAPPVLTVELAIGAPGTISRDVGSPIAISPDGRTLALAVMHPDGTTHLYVRPLDSLTARELPGTTGVRGPFFSPDGRWIGFHAGSQVKKVLAAGGASPVALAESTDFLGGSWSEDGYIVAALNRTGRLWRIPENGGEPTPLIDASADAETVRWPEILPGGRAVLFTSTQSNSPAAIEVARLPGGERTTLIQGGSSPRYAAGRLLYVDGGTLLAAPFDAGSLTLTGSPVAVAEDVAYHAGFGYAGYGVSRSGSLAYLRSADSGLSTLAWLTEGGGMEPLLDEPSRYVWPRLSPDGRSLAYARIEGGDPDLWVLDIATGSKQRLTFGRDGRAAPLWTPDGSLLLSLENGAPQLVVQRPDGSDAPRPLLPPGANVPWSFTPDGGRLAYHGLSLETGFDLWTAPVLQRAGEQAGALQLGEPELFRRTQFMETYPSFSPDGRWLAYASEESGSWEVWVRAFPDNGRAVRASSAGGRISVWSPTTDEILYETSDRLLMAARYTVSDGAIAIETARPWSPVSLADTGVLSNFNLSVDGRVVAVVPAGERSDGRHVTLVTGFAESLARGAGTER